MSITLGDRLRLLMRNHEPRLNQDKMARSIGVSPVMVSYYLNGERLPSINKLVNISKLFDVSVDWLLTGKEPRRLPNGYDVLDISKLPENEKLAIKAAVSALQNVA